MRRHRRSSGFTCPICNADYHTKADISTHITFKHGPSCKKCNTFYGCSKGYKLYKHLKRCQEEKAPVLERYKVPLPIMNTRDSKKNKRRKKAVSVMRSEYSQGMDTDYCNLKPLPTKPADGKENEIQNRVVNSGPSISECSKGRKTDYPNLESALSEPSEELKNDLYKNPRKNTHFKENKTHKREVSRPCMETDNGNLNSFNSVAREEIINNTNKDLKSMYEDISDDEGISSDDGSSALVIDETAELEETDPQLELAMSLPEIFRCLFCSKFFSKSEEFAKHDEECCSKKFQPPAVAKVIDGNTDVQNVSTAVCNLPKNELVQHVKDGKCIEGEKYPDACNNNSSNNIVPISTLQQNNNGATQQQDNIKLVNSEMRHLAKLCKTQQDHEIPRKTTNKLKFNLSDKRKTHPYHWSKQEHCEQDINSFKKQESKLELASTSSGNLIGKINLNTLEYSPPAQLSKKRRPSTPPLKGQCKAEKEHEEKKEEAFSETPNPAVNVHHSIHQTVNALSVDVPLSIKQWSTPLPLTEQTKTKEETQEKKEYVGPCSDRSNHTGKFNHPSHYTVNAASSGVPLSINQWSTPHPDGAKEETYVENGEICSGTSNPAKSVDDPSRQIQSAVSSPLSINRRSTTPTHTIHHLSHQSNQTKNQSFNSKFGDELVGKCQFSQKPGYENFSSQVHPSITNRQVESVTANTLKSQTKPNFHQSPSPSLLSQILKSPKGNQQTSDQWYQQNSKASHQRPQFIQQITSYSQGTPFNSRPTSAHDPRSVASDGGSASPGSAGRFFAQNGENNRLMRCHLCSCHPNILTKQDLRRHYLASHKDWLVTKIKTPSPLLLWCEECDYRTRVPEYLSEHISKMHQQGVINCESCDYTCLYANELVVHQRMCHFMRGMKC